MTFAFVVDSETAAAALDDVPEWSLIDAVTDYLGEFDECDRATTGAPMLEWDADVLTNVEAL